jgi:hypothetical protein
LPHALQNAESSEIRFPHLEQNINAPLPTIRTSILESAAQMFNIVLGKIRIIIRGTIVAERSALILGCETP